MLDEPTKPSHVQGTMQFRYFVELKRNLADKEEKPMYVYVKAYNRGHVCDIFDEYYVLTVDRAEHGDFYGRE